MYNAIGDIYIPKNTRREVIMEQENTLHISGDVVSSYAVVSSIIMGFLLIMSGLNLFINCKNKPLKNAIKQNTDCIEEFKKEQDISNKNIVLIKESVARIEGRLNPVK